jgi:hypothetical protein
MMRYAVDVPFMDRTRSAYKVFVGKPEGKNLIGSPRRRWGDNIRMILKRVWGCGMDSFGLGYRSVMGCYEPLDYITSEG